MNMQRTLTVYNASAGSGKTYTLALKYISLALKGEKYDNEETGQTEYRFNKNNYSHILAVTFTNKATGEMKGRILKYLFALANPDFRTADDLGFMQKVAAETGLSETEISRRSADMLEAIMQDYDHFKVETIDSFFQTLLTSMSHEMNLPRSFKVDLDDKALVADAVNRFLTDLKNERGAQSAMKRVAALLNDYIEQKSKWDISKELTHFAQENLFKDLMMNKEEALAAYMDGDGTQLAELRTRLREKMKEIDAELKQCCRPIMTLIKQIEAKPQYQDDKTLKISPIIKYIEGVLNHTLFPTEKVNMPAIVKKMTDASLLKDLVGDLLYKPFKDKNKNYVDDDFLPLIERTFELSELCNKYQKVYNSCQLTLQKLSTLSLLSNIHQAVKQLTAERGTHLLANTPKLFSRMVKKEDASFIYERLGTTLHHIMIDEFQDTSHAQWENFKLLIGEMLSQGQQCMLVGDVKQSIYRWRGGDWGILGHIESERGIGSYVNRLPKMVNYRSQPLIVRFNNAFFVKAASYCDCNSATRTEGEVEWQVPTNWQEAIYEGELKNKFAEGESEDTLVEQRNATPTEPQDEHKGTPIIPMKRIYQDVVQIANKGGNEVGKPNGYVFIKLLDKDHEAQALKELSQKIDLVKEVCKIEYKDMLILVRTNGQAKKVIDYMQSNRPELPLTTEEAFMYGASDMVNCLVNALKYITEMDALKAEVDQAISDEDKAAAIKKYDEGADHQLSLFRLMQCYVNLIGQAKKEWDDANDLKPALDEFVKQLKSEQWRAEWHRIPLYELLQLFMRTLRLDELNNRGLLNQAAYLHSFMDEVVAFADEQTSDMTKFVAYWDESLANKSIASNASDAISVMTIHKAKGLERHTVFIPFGDMNLESDGPGLNPTTLTCDVTEITEHDAEAKDLLGDLPVIPIAMGKAMDNSFYHDCYAYDHLQQRVDNLNTLYVAFTRAGTNLFVWSKSYGKDSGMQTTSALLKAFVSHEEQKIDEEDEKPYYEFGRLEPRPQALEPAEAQQEPKKNANPFDDDNKPQELSIALQPSQLQNVQFIQSKEAKAFMSLLPAKDEKKEEARLRGLFYHDLLSRIETLDDLPRALNDLVAEGKITESEKATHEAYVRKHVTNKSMYAKWFDGSYRLYNECSIFALDADGTMKERRPDRVMMNDHEVIIIDYKTADEHKGYTSQVSEYRDLLHQMTGLPVKAYLWYLEKDECHSV